MTTSDSNAWTPLFDALPDWRASAAELAATFETRLADGGHGHLVRWRAAIERLPALVPEAVEFADTVTVRGTIDEAGRLVLAESLDALHPWRKGPFEFFGVRIDTEWRSDWKWRRVAPHVGRLDGLRILDVGCGNGYFGWRMLAAGARLVVGIDPTHLYCMQHRAINRYVRSTCNWVLPLRFEELPRALFDAVFSMGVIYHRRDPLEHVRHLFDCLTPGGRVVLESLVVTGGPDLVGAERYARMRNVHVVPAVTSLTRWLREAGFIDVAVVDVTRTTTGEQRSTPWMRFESLAAALDPADPTRTVEGLPAPVRAIVLARKPG
ncbi:MAG: tRNA 5-methoxyuridine(34)/uridine 5-oxyacetic acid(34) synthase CmoB [Pseudomonadales bacterium]|nr:tRNA 5-methoxyuridine(34)/uridine 5-oxyacetic acid(34) synthase CmoB [Pseudomonadales bacterium]